MVIEALIWIVIIVGVPALLAGFGMGAAFVVGDWSSRRRRSDFTGDQHIERDPYG